MEEVLTAMLVAIEERLAAIEAQVAARSAPAPEIRQALDDILRTYGLAGQTAEVARNQHAQILALTESIGLLLSRLGEHDAKSAAERADIYELMVQLRELARKHVAHLDTIEQRIGVDQMERARIHPDGHA